MYAFDYAPLGSNLNTLEIQNTKIASTSAYISSPYGLSGTKFIGGRIIYGEGAPTGSINAFIGDTYIDFTSSSEYLCTQMGYYKSSTSYLDSVWTEK